MLENALGTAHNQEYATRNTRGSVYLSEHGYDRYEAQQMTELAVGQKVTFTHDYSNPQDMVRAFESGEVAVMGTNDYSHAWSVNAAYAKKGDGSFAVVVDRDDQNNDAENFQPVSPNAIASASGVENGGGYYGGWGGRWR